MNRGSFFGAVVAGAAGLLLTRLPAGATVADDLCAALDDPCIVSTAVVVDPASVLDFGTREFQIADGGSLTWSSDLTIMAGNCAFAAKSKVAEAKDSAGTGFLQLTCTRSNLAGSITTVGAGVIVEGDGPHVFSGKLKATGDQVGVIAIDSHGSPGHITVTGKIQAHSKTGTPPGEFRLWTNFGDILFDTAASIKLKGLTAAPSTEFFFFEADSGTVTLNGKIATSTKSGAYGFDFEGDGNVVFGPKSKVVAKATGTGTAMAINSQSGDVTLQGKIQAQVKEATAGARVHVCASHDILVAGGAAIDVSDKGSAGSIIIGAGNQARVGNIDQGAKLYAKNDGDIEVCGNDDLQSGFIYSKSKVVPDPAAVGHDICLSPTSQVIFVLACNQ